MPPASASAEELGYLFIVTYGRSGSTLLQGILNTVPGYLIRGENRQVLRHHFEADRTLSREKRKHRRWIRHHQPGEDLPVTHAFFGIEHYQHGKALRSARTFALNTFLLPREDTRVVGFKEIRWAEQDTSDYVAWLQQVFPGARFIVNTRDLGDVASSAWWQEDPDAGTHLARADEQVLSIARELADHAFHVHYDDYVADPDNLRPLFEWLGESFDIDRIREVMGVRHSWPYDKRGEQVEAERRGSAD